MEAVEIARTRNCVKQPALWQTLNGYVRMFN